MGVLRLTGASAREAIRSPIPYVVAGTSAFLYWAGSALEVLALSRDPSRSLDLVVGTVETCAALVAILLAAKLAGEDRQGDLTAVLAASAAGPEAARVGRVLAAGAVGLLATLPTLVMAQLLMQNTIISTIQMYSAVTQALPLIALEVLALAAWAALAGWAIGTWSGIACGVGLFVAARIAPATPWLAWLPASAARDVDALEVVRAVLALVAPLALGSVAARRDTSLA